MASTQARFCAHVHARVLYPAEGEGEEKEGHQEVEDPLQDPGGKLAGDGDLFAAGDQVGADEFAGPAEQGDGREPDDGCGEQAADGGMWFQRV